MYYLFGVQTKACRPVWRQAFRFCFQITQHKRQFGWKGAERCQEKIGQTKRAVQLSLSSVGKLRNFLCGDLIGTKP